MTIRELRKVLFEVEDRGLTTKELREILCVFERQDDPVDVEAIRLMTRHYRRSSSY